LAVRNGPFGETMLPGDSKAFAVVDHQVAHLYVQDPSVSREEASGGRYRGCNAGNSSPRTRKRGPDAANARQAYFGREGQRALDPRRSRFSRRSDSTSRCSR
jgi:hypothetical protein